MCRMNDVFYCLYIYHTLFEGQTYARISSGPTSEAINRYSRFLCKRFIKGSKLEMESTEGDAFNED